MTSLHPLRCETCTKKHGTSQYPAVSDSFYATNEGIMICEVDGEPIKFPSYIRTHTHGCASHSSDKESSKVLDEFNKLLDAYVQENRQYLDVGIKVGTVRRMITIAKKRVEPLKWKRRTNRGER